MIDQTKADNLASWGYRTKLGNSEWGPMLQEILSEWHQDDYQVQILGNDGSPLFHSEQQPRIRYILDSAMFVEVGVPDGGCYWLRSQVVGGMLFLERNNQKS